jgi:hypothetical protein
MTEGNNVIESHYNGPALGMTEKIKKTATTSAGYIYQTRQGVKLLCDWLDAPSRYTRVKFECDDEAEAPTGLDDIVAERSDGRVDFQQVKFTPRPEAYPLSWDWMFEKSGKTDKSRTMLRKWFDAFNKLDPIHIGEVSLLTNRQPDAAIEHCLTGDKISFVKVPEPMRTRLIAELGSVEGCERFFGQLHIRHSDKHYSSLEQEVDSRLRPHGVPEGIANLKNQALNWATLKNSPPPNGWITLTEVRSILQAAPPAPLPEDFVVPSGYEVPDTSFHLKFVEDVLGMPKLPIVLSGPPGRGKSTYLSALCDELVTQGIPHVRHHYYLSTTERGRDRLHSYVVEQSIKAQLEQFHKDVPHHGGSLRSLLEACTAHYKAQGKPFVLILDGLDHVWRTNAKDKRPLDDLFTQVLPCPENLVLLVGTQPVDDDQLPSELLAHAPKSTWRILPSMSEDAVLSYLSKMVFEGRLTTGSFNERQAEEELLAAATALRTRTNGHPLHVIYATEELVHAHGRLSRWDVEQLKGDLTNDAKTYYASLWTSLLPSLKDVLRLVSAFQFFWPKSAFTELAAAVKTVPPNVTEVEHLLHTSLAGLKVFHESLAVFVRSSDDYQVRIDELMPEVAHWLENSAPKSLRVNWLWSVQAKLGQPQNLIAGLNRDWVMLRLEEGFPELLFETLLSEAMVAALDSGCFSDAYRLAHLKARVLDGRKFQMQSDDHARLMAFTWALAPEHSVILEAVASRHETGLLQVAALGLALRFRGNQFLAEKCGEEALHRFRGLSRFSNHYQSGGGADEFAFLIDAFSKLGCVGATPEAFGELVDKNSSYVWLPRMRMLEANGALDTLITVATTLPYDEDKRLVSDACIRAAARAGANIAERDDFYSLAHTPLVATVRAILNISFIPLSQPIPVDWLKGNYYERKHDLAELTHHWFFSAVHLTLIMAAEAQSNFAYTRAPKFKERGNLTTFFDALTAAGAQIAHCWLKGESVEFHVLFELLEPVEFQTFRQSHDWSQAAGDFRNSLHRIACDIFFVSSLFTNSEDVLLSLESLTKAKMCVWFDNVSFRSQYSSGFPMPMTDAAAAEFVQAERVLFNNVVLEETSVRLQTPLELCEIALIHGLRVDASELCRQTWELTAGYGHRKDPALGDALDAIGYLVDVAPLDASRLLGMIAPQVHHVLDFTDGKGTRHVLLQADRLLAKLKPSALVVKYAEHTDAGDWWEAENSLLSYVEQGIEKNWPLAALMRTGVHSDIQDSLERTAQSGSAHASDLLRILTAHVGADFGVLRRDERTGTGDSKPYTGDVTAFEPERLDDLLASLAGSYEVRKELLQVWYAHWESAGQGRRLLAVLEESLLSDEGRRKDIYVLLILAFETKRKLSGSAAAWVYLVQAQIVNGAWFGYMESSEKICHRLDLVAKYYRKRCDEFVIKSTYSMFSDPTPSRIVPNDVMVYFLAIQGRIGEAVQFAETMVNCIIEDTRTLPLAAPNWAAKLLGPTVPDDLMDELHILIARLGWPSTSSRWWAMQELALRLAEQATRTATETALLGHLRERKLEAEAVEVLSIFWLATKGFGYTPPPDLIIANPKPSLLANMLMASLGFAVVEDARDLKQLPKGFEAPQDFGGVQGVDLPRLFLTRMKTLEHFANLPFQEQMAFEWWSNRLAYPDAPYQGDAGYFLRPMGNGFAGHLSTRTALRAISAYLRTLDVGMHLWRMPVSLAEQVALSALPLHPTLAFLRPCKPDWYPAQGFDRWEDLEATEASLKSLLSHVEQARPGDEIIAFSSPVRMSRKLCIEFSAIRWSQAAGGKVADADLAAHLSTIWSGARQLSSSFDEPFGTASTVESASFDELFDEESACWPRAGFLDFARMGYLQHDLFPSRLFVPTLSGVTTVDIVPAGEHLEAKQHGESVAELSYWNAGWGPTRPSQLCGNCGTALISRGFRYRNHPTGSHEPMRDFYLWQLRKLRRNGDYDQFNEELTFGVMFV